MGVGNLLRCDDGAGVHVVNRLRESEIKVDAIDVALGSVEILEAMKGYQRVIIIDAIKTGEKPGTIFYVNLNTLEKAPRFSSSHGIDIMTTLELGNRLYGNEMPNEIIVIGIEAADITTLSEKCTPQVSEAVEEVVKKLSEMVS